MWCLAVSVAEIAASACSVENRLFNGCLADEWEDGEAYSADNVQLLHEPQAHSVQEAAVHCSALATSLSLVFLRLSRPSSAVLLLL